MSTQYNTIKVGDQSFNVRGAFAPTLNKLEGQEFKHIQHLLCELFSLVDDIHSDEFALAVFIHFPKSSIVSNRKDRAVADVRKYNGGKFAIQVDVPETSVKLIDGGTRSGGSDKAHAIQAMQAVKGQLKA